LVLAGSALLVGLLVGAGTAGGASSPPRLDGSFALKVTVAGGSNLLDRKVGDVLNRKWSFAPRCTRGACNVVLSRQSPNGGIVVVPLKLNGTAYVGTETFVGPYSCGGQIVQGGESGPITWTVRVTASQSIGGELHATRIEGGATERFAPTAALKARGCKTPVTEFDKLLGTRVGSAAGQSSSSQPPPAGA